MSDTPAASPPKARQELHRRMLWFVAGSVVNYLLISAPLHWLEKHASVPWWGKPACALAISSTVFFLWNYKLNFRTASRKRDALHRYLVAVLIMWGLSSVTLAWLKSFNAHLSFSIGRVPLDLDVIATQFFLAGLKFSLYHLWVFPPAKTHSDLVGSS